MNSFVYFRKITRIYTTRAMGPYEELPFFFGHINFNFLDCPRPATLQDLKYCSHVYGVTTLSPGSSQLPPEELGYIFTKRINEDIDPAVFSTLSFPAWYAFEVSTSVVSSPSSLTDLTKQTPTYVYFMTLV